MHEETGLQVSRIERYLGNFDYNSRRATPTRQFCFLVSVVNAAPILLREHAGYVWRHFKKTDTDPVSPTIKRLLESLN